MVMMLMGTTMIAMMISESHGRMMLTLALRLPMQKWRRLRVRFQLALMPDNAEPPERPPPGDFSALALAAKIISGLGCRRSVRRVTAFSMMLPDHFYQGLLSRGPLGLWLPESRVVELAGRRGWSGEE